MSAADAAGFIQQYEQSKDSGFSLDHALGLDNLIGNIKSGIAQHWQDFLHSIGEYVHEVMKNLIDWILQTPFVGSDPITMKVWTIVKVISFSLIGLILAYEAFKNISVFERGIGSAMEFKQLLVKIIYAVMLSIFSLNIVNIFIGLSNSFVQTLANNFPLDSIANTPIGNIESSLLYIVMAIVQIIIAIRLIISYWMRQTRIYLLAVLGPLIYILGIRSNTNRVSTWLHDLATTIFSQVIQALILVLYTMLTSLASSQGTFSSLCLSIATMLFMLEAPPMLQQYIGAAKGGIADPIASIKRTAKTVAKVKNPAITVAGWFKK